MVFQEPLKAFSDYFPNSQIYGADVDTEILKDFKNVKTFYINQMTSALIKMR